MPELLAEVAGRMPVLVLTNGSLFGPRMLDRLAPLAGKDVALQLSLDSMRAASNDALRAPGNRDQVLASIAALLHLGLRVRIATTVEGQSAEELEEICAMHRSFGIPDADHVVRPVVRRGRAAARGMGEGLRETDVLPELTVTADGVFMHPFAPTLSAGRTDTDLLVAGSGVSLAGPPAVSSTPSSSFPPAPTSPETSGEADAGTPVGEHSRGAAGAGNTLALLSMGDYLPIEEHGVIGDLHTVALVGTDGTIDWYCPERFDSPSVFAVDPRRGARAATSRSRRSGTITTTKQLYHPDTYVLITRFLTPDGVGEVEDFMPIHRDRQRPRGT